MKQITFYSTCQGEAIAHYLKHYFEGYNFSIIRNYQLVLYQENFTEFINILGKTNIFIYQEMPSKWNEFSTDESIENNILSHLPNECTKIIIPYVYSEWLYGINKIILRDGTANFDTISHDTNTKIKYINGDIIINLKKSNYDLDTILKLYDNNELDFKYEERKQEGIKILKYKEKTADIKVSDFILRHYKKQKLFYMPNHPSHIVLKEMTKQILEKLNINYNNFDKLFENNNFDYKYDLPISKYDKNYYNFEFEINCEDDKIKEIITEIYKMS